MRFTTACLLVFCLLVAEPGNCSEPNFSVHHYTPCEVLWIENGQNVGLCVNGEYVTGRISPIEFPPMDEGELLDLVQRLKKPLINDRTYLDPDFPDDEAIEILRGFEGCVDIALDTELATPVHAALIESQWLFWHDELPPQIMLWRCLAGARAVYLDDGTAESGNSSGANDLTLYSYRARWGEPSHSLEDTFNPLGLDAFRAALDRQMPLTEADWPQQYFAYDHPWVNFICLDSDGPSQLRIGDWFVAEAPFAVRLEETKNYDDYYAELKPGDPFAPIEVYKKLRSDDRGRLTVGINLSRNTPQEITLQTTVRLLNGQGIGLNLDQDKTTLVVLISLNEKTAQELRTRAGFDITQ